MIQRTNLLGALAIGIALLAPRAGFGQTAAERASARAAAESGADAYDQGKFADAVDLFGRAEKLVHAPPHLLYIARASVKLGRLVDAHEAYVSIVQEDLARGAPDIFKDAKKAAETELRELEARMPKLTIVVSTSSGGTIPGLSVTMGGKLVQNALIGIPQFVDPGKYECIATAPGMSEAKATVTIAEKAQETITLKLEPAGGAGGPPVPGSATGQGQSQPAGEPPQASGSLGLRITGYAALGVGAVSLGLGTLYFFQAKATQDDSDSAYRSCRPNCDAAQRAHVNRLDSNAQDQRLISTVGFITGGVGVAAGITLLLLEGRSQHPARGRPVFRPWVGLGAAGLAGQF